MKHLQIAFLSIFLFCLSEIKAQTNHFIYIQTENKLPFYVKLNNKLYNSSPSGYIVIAKLKEGIHNLSIGFPKSEWSEQNLSCTINQNDIGFLLKNFDNKGWGLFNLQTFAVIMPADKSVVNKAAVTNNTDAFSTMLSNVVNDSTIRQTEVVVTPVKTVAATEPKKPDTIVLKENIPITTPIVVDLPKEKEKPVAIKAVKEELIVAKESKNQPSTNNQSFITISESKSSITRSLFNRDKEGTEIVFVDDISGKKDTIRVFIPSDKNAGATPDVLKEVKKHKETKSAEIIKPVETEKKNKFIDVEISSSNDITKEKVNKPIKENLAVNNKKEIVVSTEQQKPSNSPMINSDCKVFGSDEDFLKLRKKMAGVNGDDEMIIMAKKVFKTKCFTVDQVKNLSVLLLKDQGKYAFFDMAYPFVSDSHNFSSLQSQLSETYYISRFQVMIRH